MSFYSYDDEAERLHCTDIDEAMTEYFDDVDPAKWTREVEIYRYEPMPISDSQKSNWASHVLDNLIEHIDEEHGDPDNATDTTKEMEEAAREFVNKVIEKYTTWWHEKVETIKVDMVEWYAGREDDEDEVKNAIERLKALPCSK